MPASFTHATGRRGKQITGHLHYGVCWLLPKIGLKTLLAPARIRVFYCWTAGGSVMTRVEVRGSSIVARKTARLVESWKARSSQRRLLDPTPRTGASP